MIYAFSLKTVSLILGIAYVLGHGFALMQPTVSRHILKDLPRNKIMGRVFMIIAAGWFAWIIATVDLMDYAKFKVHFLIGVVVATYLVLQYLQEFLAVRALGSILILLAGVLLDAAFMQPQSTRLVLVVLAYIYIIVGMVWVCSPYLMRDMITLLTKDSLRYKIAAALGCGFGFLLIGLAFLSF